MGSRAGIIVIDADGAIEVFYDHWAAQTLAQDAALAGFSSTLERVRTMAPMGVSSVEEWVSATWMEGSMLIDIPNRRVAWAEEGEALVLPRIANHLIELTWPGWTAVWAPDEVRGIIHLAGADPAPLFAGWCPSERQTLADDQWFAPSSDQMAGWPLSVRLDDGAVVLWRTDSGLDALACYGADDVIAFASRARDDATSGEGWGALWRTGQGRFGTEWPGIGAHVDVPTKTLSWWATWEQLPSDREFDAYWPGWTIRSLGDAYEWHEQVVGGIPLQASWREQVEQARGHFRWMCKKGPRPNPFVRIASHLIEQGHDVQPLPGVLQFVASAGFGGAEAIDAVLAQLADGPPLPPARFVDLHGVVHEPCVASG